MSAPTLRNHYTVLVHVCQAKSPVQGVIYVIHVLYVAAARAYAVREYALRLL